ncbi:MAG: DUF1905 domain-containing protein [Mycobacteriales bacterium]|nr:DUF1905 domain-containing protein [Mycobacteriales bacterium]
MGSYRFDAELWEHAGEAAWHFVTVPAELSEDLRGDAGPRRGFGSVRVRVTIGGSTWSTSVFPSAAGPFLLPVKKAVRRAEELEAGDTVAVELVVDEASRPG